MEDLHLAMPKRYRNGGLVIESDFSLDELAPLANGALPDVTIARVPQALLEQKWSAAEVVRTVGDERDPWLVVSRADDGYVLRWGDRLDVFVWDGGRRLEVAQRRALDDSLARLLLCHSLSFTLHEHGREGLHASAVEIGGMAFLIVGDSGSGKSTLATALCRLGARLISDDVAILSVRGDGRVVAEPSSKITWLLHGVAGELVGASANDGPRTHKVAVNGGRLVVADRSSPVAGVYLLRYRPGEPQIMTAEEGANAALAVVAGAFNSIVRTSGRLATQFQVSSALAASATIRRVEWAPSPASAQLVAARIFEEHGNAELAAVFQDGAHNRPRNLEPHDGRRRLVDTLREAGIVDLSENDQLDEPLLRTSEVAALLRTSDRTIRMWADAGKLTYVKTLGGRRMFPASGVIEVLNSMNGHKSREE